MISKLHPLSLTKSRIEYFIISFFNYILFEIVSHTISSFHIEVILLNQKIFKEKINSYENQIVNLLFKWNSFTQYNPILYPNRTMEH